MSAEILKTVEEQEGFRVLAGELPESAGNLAVHEEVAFDDTIPEASPLEEVLKRQERFIQRITGDLDTKLSSAQVAEFADGVASVHAARSRNSRAVLQSQVLSRISRGALHREIAEELGISAGSVKSDYQATLRGLVKFGLSKPVLKRIAEAMSEGQSAQELFAPFLVAPEPPEPKTSPKVCASRLQSREIEDRDTDYEKDASGLNNVDEDYDENETAPGSDIMTSSVDPVRDYLKKIGKTPLLNAEQEVDLAKRIEAGLFAKEKLDSGAKLTPLKRKELASVVEDGRRAKNLMLESNLRLAVSIAKRYTGRGMLFLDLIQEGNLGLIRAVEKFDYTKGYKFSTYAIWWIRQAITRAMADQGRTIRVPVHMVEVINKLSRVQRDMIQDLGREPTPDELAIELGITREKVLEVQKYSREPISLHTPIGEYDSDTELGDRIEDSDAIDPPEAAAFMMLSEQLQEVLDTLSEREAGVIRMRFGLTDGQPKTLDEIGKRYGVTRERIRQIEKEVMAKLQHPSRSERLRDYLN